MSRRNSVRDEGEIRMYVRKKQEGMGYTVREGKREMRICVGTKEEERLLVWTKSEFPGQKFQDSSF